MTLNPYFIDTDGSICHSLRVSKQRSLYVCSPNITIFSPIFSRELLLLLVLVISLSGNSEAALSHYSASATRTFNDQLTD
jgi:hypothetical protein